jgi:hypothetical protein
MRDKSGRASSVPSDSAERESAARDAHEDLKDSTSSLTEEQEKRLSLRIRHERLMKRIQDGEVFTTTRPITEQERARFQELKQARQMRLSEREAMEKATSDVDREAKTMLAERLDFEYRRTEQ